jgi:hypothetical protein
MVSSQNWCADAEADLPVPIEAEMSEDTADDDISSKYVNLLFS